MLSQIEEREGSVRPSIEFEVGDSVKVSDGPFESQNGIVEEMGNLGLSAFWILLS